MKVFCVVALLSICCGVAPAQNLSAVPSAWRDIEAPSVSSVPGIGVDGRRQYVIGAAHLQTLLGKQIVGIAFRRNAEWSDALSGGTGQVVVRIGQAAFDPAHVRPSLAANLPVPLEAYRGSVTLPPAPPVGSYAGWSSPHGVSIAFQSVFTYTGGPLCVEIDGSSVGGPHWWPVDGVEDPIAGQVFEEGVACGPRVAQLVRTALVPERTLVVGGSVPFTYLGEPGTIAQLLIGFATLSTPIDLGWLGSPGCELRVAALAGLPAIVRDVGATAGGGVGQVVMHLPTDPGLFAGEFVVQWVQLGATITTSNTLRCRLAGAGSSLGMSTISEEVDGSTQILTTQAPVFGLLWQ